MDDRYKSVGERLRAVRVNKGITQAQLAQQVRTSPDMIGKYERGEVSPSWQRLVEIAAALDISPADLC